MKNNGTLWRIATVIIAAASILTGIGLTYGRLYQKVNNHSTSIKDNTKKIERYAEDVIRLQENVEYIKKAVDRIEQNNE